MQQGRHISFYLISYIYSKNNIFTRDLSQEVNLTNNNVKYDNKTSFLNGFGKKYSYDKFKLENVSRNKRLV